MLATQKKIHEAHDAQAQEPKAAAVLCKTTRNGKIYPPVSGVRRIQEHTSIRAQWYPSIQCDTREGQGVNGAQVWFWERVFRICYGTLWFNVGGQTNLQSFQITFSNLTSQVIFQMIQGAENTGRIIFLAYRICKGTRWQAQEQKSRSLEYQQPRFPIVFDTGR